jgi:hypothetical protein
MSKDVPLENILEAIDLVEDCGREIAPGPGPGRFRCEMCGGTFDLGDDDEARAEAEARGLDVDDCGLVCDACYRLTPWGMGRG